MAAAIGVFLSRLQAVLGLLSRRGFEGQHSLGSGYSST